MSRMFNAIMGAIVGACLGIGISFLATGSAFAESFAFPGDIAAVCAVVFAACGALWGNDFLHEVVERLQ